MRRKTLLATLFDGSVHTIATCRAIRRATCVEECERCVQVCARSSQWNRSHSDACQRTFRHNVTSLHALNICDAVGTCRLCRRTCVRVLSHYRTHVAPQIAWRVLWKHYKVTGYSSSQQASPWELTCHMGSLCYMPPGRGDIPTFTQRIKAGTWFSDPEGMQGWVELVGLGTYQGGTRP